MQVVYPCKLFAAAIAPPAAHESVVSLPCNQPIIFICDNLHYMYELKMRNYTMSSEEEDNEMACTGGCKGKWSRYTDSRS